LELLPVSLRDRNSSKREGRQDARQRAGIAAPRRYGSKTFATKLFRMNTSLSMTCARTTFQEAHREGWKVARFDTHVVSKRYHRLDVRGSPFHELLSDE
jgi:hypothetical protein